MNQEAKAKWLEALRSGEFKQGKGVLKRRGPDQGTFSYCCLGVLCEVLKLESANECYLDDKLAEELGLSGDPGDDSDREILKGNDQYKLATMNDNGETFEEIANWIEANL